MFDNDITCIAFVSTVAHISEDATTGTSLKDELKTQNMSVTQYSPASLAVLLQNVSIDEDDEQILKHANNVLKKTKSDQSALRAKLVALIKLDRYNDALRLLEGDDSKNVIENTELEHAYCLYKVGRINEASELAHKGTAGEKRKRGLQHVEAQSVCAYPSNRVDVG